MVSSNKLRKLFPLSYLLDILNERDDLNSVNTDELIAKKDLEDINEYTDP